MLPRQHLIGCQGVKMFLLNDHFTVLFFIIENCNILSFVTIWVFEFCHIFNSQVSSQYEYCQIDFFLLHKLIFVPIWVFSQLDFCHNLSFVTIWVLAQLESYQNSTFVPIWVYEFCHNLSFEFCHNLCFF